MLSQKSMSCISRATGQKARYTLIQRLPVAGAYLRSPLSLLHWILGRVSRKTDTTIACWTRPRAMSGHDWAGWPLYIRALEVDLAHLPHTAAVCDIVYIPLETGLLAAARSRGNRCIDGLGMLLHQGRPGFEAWFGVKVDVSPEQRRAVAADLGV